MEIWAALGFIALGMLVAHTYNWLAWRKFYEGKREACDVYRKAKGA